MKNEKKEKGKKGDSTLAELHLQTASSGPKEKSRSLYCKIYFSV
jgi:hypothetical protein